MRGVICIGLRNGKQVAALAPRLITEDGKVTIGEPLHFTAGLPKPGQRVTYLASVLKAPGLYDCEVSEDGTIVPATTPLTEIPEFAERILTAREWRATPLPTPEKPEPARVRR